MVVLTEDQWDFRSVPVHVRGAAPLITKVDQNSGCPFVKCNLVQGEGIAVEHHHVRFQRRQFVGIIYPAPARIGKKQTEIVDLPGQHFANVDQLARAAVLEETITTSVWVVSDKPYNGAGVFAD